MNSVLYGLAESWLFLLLAWAVKGSLLLFFVWLLTVLLRRASAALRHSLWTIGVLGVLLIPLLTFLLPAWQSGTLSRLARDWSITRNSDHTDETASGTSPIPRESASTRDDACFRDQPVGVATRIPGTQVDKPSPGREESGWESGAGAGFNAALPLVSAGLCMVWLGGMGLLLILYFAGILRLKSLLRAAEPITDEIWTRKVQPLADSLGIRKRVKLLRSHRELAPMSVGIRSPLLLLPSSCESWGESRRYDIFLHELAHVKRRDAFTQVLAQLSCLVFWFNPLVWLAAAKMRLERERACDDQVLRMGVLPSSYADNLLDIARSLRRPRPGWDPALALARKAQIADRLGALLEPGRRRSSLDRRGILLMAGLIALVLVPLATLNPDDATGSSRRASEFPAMWAGIDEANARFEAAVRARDAAGVAAVYAPDALLFSGEDMMRGRGEIQEHWEEIFSLGFRRIEIEPWEVGGNSDAAYELGEFTLVWLWRLKLIKGRYLTVWQREGDRWLIQRDISTL